MKTDVYSWRLSPDLKSELQEAARAERKSVADLLEEIVKGWLQHTRGHAGTEEERQQQVFAWNDMARPFPAQQRLHDGFEAQLAVRPNAPARLCARQALAARPPGA